MADRETAMLEVIYALPQSSTSILVSLTQGMTVADAIAASDIASIHPEIDTASCLTGIFGRRVALTATLQAGDRVEIYRPLQADPKQARRLRGRLRKAA